MADFVSYTPPPHMDASALIRRADSLLNRWTEKYGLHGPQWLPPAGINKWQEDAARYLAAHTLPAPSPDFVLSALNHPETRAAHRHEAIRAARNAKADMEATFRAQHEFLEWNRQQAEPLVKIAYEYGVFHKAVELYLDALGAPGIPAPKLTDEKIAELWYGGREPGHEVAPGYAVNFARAIEAHVSGAQVNPQPSTGALPTHGGQQE